LSQKYFQIHLFIYSFFDVFQMGDFLKSTVKNKIKLTLLTFLLITFLHLFGNLAIFNTLTNNLTCITICLLWTMMSENKLSCVIITLVADTFCFKFLVLLSQLMHNLLAIFYTWKIIILNHYQPLFISNLAKLLPSFPSNISFKAISNF
jgi:hypothetical protein